MITTPQAEASCAKNKKKFVELLRSQNTSRVIAVKGPNERTYPVKDFQLRFMELSEFARPRQDVDEALYRLVLSNSSEEPYCAGCKIQDRSDIAQFQRG